MFVCLQDLRKQINIKLLIKQLQKFFNSYFKNSIKRYISEKKLILNKEEANKYYNKYKFHRNEIIPYINNLIKSKII